MSKQKHSGFDRLKLATSLGVALGGLLGASRSARAASATLPVSVSAANVTWIGIDNETVCSGTFGFTSGERNPAIKPKRIKGQPAAKGKSTTCAFGISEATLFTGPLRPVVRGGAASFSDAFDGALGLAVNGELFNNPDTTVDLTGTTVTSDAALLSGLSTRVQYYFSPTLPVARAVYSFTNTTGAPINAAVRIASNLGSDSSTDTLTTADGDATPETTDRWIVTGDGADSDDDPNLLWVRFGPGAVSPVSAQFEVPDAGNGSMSDGYDLQVAPGATVRLMVFVRLYDPATPLDAATIDSVFANTTTLQGTDLLNGLGAAELSQVANWAAAAAAVEPYRAIPLLDHLGKLGLMLTILAGGVVAARYRHRHGN